MVALFATSDGFADPPKTLNPSKTMAAPIILGSLIGGAASKHVNLKTPAQL